MSGKRKDGIRSMEDMRLRCVIDEAGCWVWKQAADAASARVWISALGRVCRMSSALYFLQHGRLPAKGVTMVPVCGNPLCANPKHRKVGDSSSLMKAVLPATRPLHSGGRKRLASYTPELARQIRASTEPMHELAKRHGFSRTHGFKVKRGEAWLDDGIGSSVFSWRPQ